MVTETITVMFTDMVGSTALLSRVGEEQAEAIRREYFALLRDVVTESGGRAVKSVGDGLMVVFPSPSAAVGAAVAIQQRLDARNRRSDEPLLVRIGISHGEADLGDGDYFGPQVVEGARLCAIADGGQIFVTEIVRALTGSRGGHQFESLGDVELKGFDIPVPAVSVLWESLFARGAGVPLPERLEPTGNLFVGRESEYSSLLDAFKRAQTSNRAGIVLVSGEPGIGKTSLVGQAARAVSDQDAVVLYGRCDEELAIPYQPWAEALRHLVVHAPSNWLSDVRPEVSRLVPEVRDRRPDLAEPITSNPDAERYVLFASVVEVLAGVSRDVPVVLVLDDLHWADRPTTQLLRNLATSDVPMRLLLVGTFRDSDIGPSHPLSDTLAALHREGSSTRVALRGLGDLELLDLMERAAGHQLDADGLALRDALSSETDGNPFFVTEILRHLAETGAITQGSDGRWVTTAELRASGLPVSVREVLGKRVARLGENATRVLSAASVIGRDFDLATLAELVATHEEDVLSVLEQAEDAALLTEVSPSQFSFAHALVEHSLYDELSATRRTRLHRRIAAIIEQQTHGEPGDRIGELAHHWAEAVESSDIATAVEYARKAGDHALSRLAPDEAVRWYTHAHELLDHAVQRDLHQRAQLLVGLGDAQRQTGIAAYRETLLEAARLADQTDDTALLVRAVLNNNRGTNSVAGVVDHDRIAAIGRALERVGDAPTAERAQLLALAAAERMYLDDLPERVALVEEAIAVARASGEQAALAWAVQRPFLSIDHPSTLALRAAQTAEACEIADRLGDPAIQWMSRATALLVAAERGDGAALDEDLRRAEEISVRIPHTMFRWSIALHQAWVTGLHGDLTEYERRAEDALTYASDNGEPDAFEIYAAQLANVRRHQGRLHELIPLLEQVGGGTPRLASFRAALAHSYAHSGRVEAAKRLVEQECAVGFHVEDGVGWSTGTVLWADTVVAVGALDAIEPLRDCLLPYHDQVAIGGVTFSGAFAYYLGRLDHVAGTYDDAERWYTEALELHERLRSPILVAYTRAAWAALLADRNQNNDRTRARTMARAAFNAALAGGYGYIEADARAVLDRLS
jgi:class 3 adenylate cyclase